MQLTNQMRKFVATLDDARVRRDSGLFKSEGQKCVADTFGYFPLHSLYATAAWIEEHRELSSRAGESLAAVTRRDLERMSHLSTPPQVIAVYEMPEERLPDNIGSDGLALALDSIQDPGNMGTIVRLADWFGIGSVVCSADSTDPYSPKAIMASMGSISRVRPVRTDLAALLRSSGSTICGTFLDGADIYSSSVPSTGIIVMGSEGHGISEEIASLVDMRLKIPPFPPTRHGAESLNVGMATAIILAEFRRRQMS